MSVDKKSNKVTIYKQEKENGSKLWEQVPPEVIDTVIQSEIGKDTINTIFKKIDELKDYIDAYIIYVSQNCYYKTNRIGQI